MVGTNNPFQVLGLSAGADADQIRAAYRALVKKCHPDQFLDADEQQAAQEKLVQLNLAYREALSKAADRSRTYVVLPPEKAWERAVAFFERQEWDRALVQLSHIEARDLKWYKMQGDILMEMKQYSSALQAYKICVKIAPEDQESHQRCLDAAVALRRQQSLPGRMKTWARNIIGKK